MVAAHIHRVATGVTIKVTRHKSAQTLSPGRGTFKIGTIRGEPRDIGEVEPQVSRCERVSASEPPDVPGDRLSRERWDGDRK